MTLNKLAISVITGSVVLASIVAGARAETLKIGVIAALTGPGAAWGMATAEGPKVLAAEVNAEGGLDVGGKKYQVQVIAYDDQYNPANSVAAYNRLVNQDGVRYVITMGSASALALKQNVEDDKVIALVSAFSEKAVDATSKYTFRLFSPPVDFLPPLTSWMKDNLKQRRVVLLNPNDETGWDQARLTDELFKQDGFEVLDSELYERSLKDFQPLLTKVIALKPDMIDLATTSPATAGLIVRQARELGYMGLFVKTGGPGPKDILAAAGKEAAEGMVELLYADPANAGYQRIVADYRKSIGQDPNDLIVATYDAANVLLHAIQKAGTVSDTTKVSAAFAQALPMPSVQGDALRLGGSFNHQIMTVNYVGVMKNGEPVIVGKIQ